MPASSRTIEKRRLPLARVFESVGNGTGVNDFAINFTESTTYQAITPAGFTDCITHVTIHFIGVGGISPDGFGGGLALINGLKMFYVQGGVDVFPEELPFITTNYGLSLVTTTEFITDYQGNDKGYKGTLDFRDLGLDCIKLNGDNGDTFKAIFNDDFTSRISIGQIVIDGYRTSNT